MKEYTVYCLLTIFFSFIISQTQALEIDENLNYTLSGFISDSKTGESVVGANVYLLGTDYGSSGYAESRGRSFRARR